MTRERKTREATNKRAATETVTTDQLRVGDRVWSWGGLFELTECRETEDSNPGTGTQLTVYSWRTRAVDVSDTRIPSHCINRDGGWTIQGNKLATWARVKR